MVPGITPTWSTSAAAVATVNTTGLVTARAAGTATITATAEDQTATATITVEAVPVDDHGISTATATTISYGDTATGKLDAGDEDFFKIEVSSTAKTVRLTAWTEGRTDTRGYLYNDKGTELVSNDDGGPGQNFQVARTVSPGTYYVKVVGYQSTTAGDYVFKVDDHGDAAGEIATTVTSATNGDIGKAGNVDYFHMNVTAGGSLVLSTTGGTDTYGVLYNSRGDSINADDDGGTDTNFSISQESVAVGDYYLRVTGYDQNTGSYVLTVSGTAGLGAGSGSDNNDDNTGGGGPNNNNNTRQTAHYMELGGVASDAIGSGTQRDWFGVRVRSSVASASTIRLTAYTVGSARVSLFLYNDLNHLLSAANPGAGSPSAVQVVLPSVSTGKYYYVMVRGRLPTDRGSYQIKVDDHGDSRTTATSVTRGGEAVVGNLASTGNIDYFKFSVDGDDTAVTIYTTGSLDTYGELRNANGGLVEANNDESKTQKNFRISRTESKALDAGTYYVRVGGQSGATGEYTLYIT